MPEYRFDGRRGFFIEGFREAPPFASFLPGIAGLAGTPMWVYTASRGQCVCSFGVESKDRAMMEYSPAEQAYREVGFTGFRTFIRQGGRLLEPFSEVVRSAARETMHVEPDRLSVQSVDEQAGLKTEVLYFTLPGEEFAALCRKVTIRNIAAQKTELEALDGPARLVPYGAGHLACKTMGNTLQAWMDVFGLEEGVPFFRVRASVEDSETAGAVTGGFFCLSTVNGKPVRPVTDVKAVFGQNTSLAFPEQFEARPLAELLALPQHPAGKFPCAFTPVRAALMPGESVEIRTFYGFLDDQNRLGALRGLLGDPGFFERKREESARLCEELLRVVACKTADPVFDAYVGQCYLDNMLRGGRPVFFPGQSGRHVFYVYSRKHGDLERDYNDFRLEANPYSQGNGNFRDVCQNRRCESLLFPETGEANIRQFAELIQADGYNPLTIRGSVFRIDLQKLPDVIRECGVRGPDAEALLRLLRADFEPGAVLRVLRGLDGPLADTEQALLAKILFYAGQDTDAAFGEGYWIDHWTYLLDLVEAYLAVFPDRCADLLFGHADYRYFQCAARVAPRSEKYVRMQGGLRQIGAVQMTGGRDGWLKTRDGKLFCTDLFAKLFTLVLVKLATPDPAGVGIEMEAGKPGWNDSLNGLPSLFGSSVAETAELRRLAGFLLDHAGGRDMTLADEVYRLYEDLNAARDKTGIAWWQCAGNAREAYRARIEAGFSGGAARCAEDAVRDFLSLACRRLDAALRQAVELGGGLCPTYLSYLPETEGAAETAPAGFAMKSLPHYLEGPARLLKISAKPEAAAMARAVRSSDLYDPKLRMYKISGPLRDLPLEAGRARAFVPGCLENESVFLHMEYKYLLGLLLAGLTDEFFSAFKDTLVPFMDPAQYGRSTLENCSYLASSAHPDPDLHGRGFAARLSGSTAEMLEIWSVMTVGRQPFSVRRGCLCLEFSPTLPGWLFDAAGELAFTFLGRVGVVYHNPSRAPLCADTARAARIRASCGGSSLFEGTGGCLRGARALAVREGRADRLDVWFEPPGDAR